MFAILRGPQDLFVQTVFAAHAFAYVHVATTFYVQCQITRIRFFFFVSYKINCPQCNCNHDLAYRNGTHRAHLCENI